MSDDTEQPPFPPGREDVLYVSRLTTSLITAWGSAPPPRLADETLRRVSEEAAYKAGNRTLQMLAAGVVALSGRAQTCGALGGGTAGMILHRLYDVHLATPGIDRALLDGVFRIIAALTKTPRDEGELFKAIDTAAHRWDFHAMLLLTQLNWCLCEKIAEVNPMYKDAFAVQQAMAIEGEIGMHADGEGHTDKPFEGREE